VPVLLSDADFEAGVRLKSPSTESKAQDKKSPLHLLDNGDNQKIYKALRVFPMSKSSIPFRGGQAVKRVAYVLILAATVMLVSQVQPVYSGEAQQNTKLIGSWTKTLNATDSAGKPCPFVPDTMEFFKDHTITMSNFGSQHLPYKTTLTTTEKQAIEKKNPDLKGKKLLLVKPNPNVDWASTPMVYGYTLEKNQLTLILQGWSPARFARAAK